MQVDATVKRIDPDFHGTGFACVALEAHASRNPLRMGVPIRRKIRDTAFAAAGRRRFGAKKFRRLKRLVRHAPVVERPVDAVVGGLWASAEIQVAIVAKGKRAARRLANCRRCSFDAVFAVDVEFPDILGTFHLVRQREVMPFIRHRRLEVGGKGWADGRIIVALSAVALRDRQPEFACTGVAAPAQNPSALLGGGTTA